MSLSQPFANSEQDCMILAATTTCFPLPKQEEQVKSHSGRFHRSYPNFKPSNPKSTWHDLWVPVGFGHSLPLKPQPKKTLWKTGGTTRYFLPKFSWGAFTSGDSPSLRRRLLNSVNRTSPRGGVSLGSVMMDWVEGQWWRGGENDQGKKGVMGEKAGEWWWNFRVDSPGIFSCGLKWVPHTFDFFWWGINTYSPFLFILRKRDAQRSEQSFRVVILS